MIKCIMNHEKPVSTTLRRGRHERHEINKTTFNRSFWNSRSQSPDWECIVIETIFCVPKVGFGNEIMGVGFGNEKIGMDFGKEKKYANRNLIPSPSPNQEKGVKSLLARNDEG